jgi:hypothetical protein
MTLLLIISFIWSYLEGKREAQYFHYKWDSASPIEIKDEHFDFTIQRSLFVIITAILAGFIYAWYASIIIFLSIALTFSFFHNGSYYKRRNEMNGDIYTNRWKDISTSTTAKTSFNYKSRLILFIIGTLLCIGFDLFFLLK